MSEIRVDKVYNKSGTGSPEFPKGLTMPTGGTLTNEGYTNFVGISTFTTIKIGNQTGITSVTDEDDMTSDSASALATQQSIKAYVDSQVTAQDLDFAGDSGGAQSVDLDSQTFTIAGTSNEIETSGSGQTLTIGLPSLVATTTLTAVDESVSGGLTVTGVSTFTGAIDANSIDLDGQADLDEVVVAGVATFSNTVDINGAIDADGGANIVGGSTLDQLNVTGIASFTQIDLSTGGLDIDGQLDVDELVVAGVSTFSSTVDVNGTLDIDGAIDADGGANIVGGATIDQANVSGVSTFTGTMDINGAIDADGGANIVGGATIDQANVSGVSTFTGAIDANGALDVDGATTLDALTVAEGATVVGGATIDQVNVTGIGSHQQLDVSTGGLDVDGQTDLDELVVAGVSTFSAAIDSNAGANIVGGATIDQANVTGVGSHYKLDVGVGGLDVDGQTDLDELVVAGVSTYSAAIDANAGANIAGGLVANSAAISDLTNNRVVIAGTSGELEDDANLTFNGSTLSVGVALDVDGATTLDGLTVAEASTFNAALDINAGIDVDGQADLDEVVVAGVATFSNTVDINGAIDADGGANIVGGSTLDQVNVTGVGSHFKLDVSTGGLDVDGQTDLDELVVAGVSTYSAAIDANAGANIAGGLVANSAAISDLTDNRVVIAGTSGELEDDANLTFNGSTLSVGVALDVDGATTVDALTAAEGVTVVGGGTFDNVRVTGIGTIDTTLYVQGISVTGGGAQIGTDVDTRNFKATGFSTFQNTMDINGAIDADGGANIVGAATIDNLNVSGVGTVASLKVSDLTNTRVVIAGASGELGDSSGLTYSSGTLAVVGDGTFTGNVSVSGTITHEDVTNVDSLGIVTARNGVRVTAGGMNVAAGIVTFADAGDFNGGLNVSGGSGFVASSAKISDLTSGRVVTAGTSGELQDASTFTFSGGTVTATAFSGSGASLTSLNGSNISSGTVAAARVATLNQDTTGTAAVATAITLADESSDTTCFPVFATAATGDLAPKTGTNLTFNSSTGVLAADGLDISTAGVDIDGLTNLDEVIVAGVSTFSAAIDANLGANISGGGLTVDNVNVSGVVTATTFVGAVTGNVTGNASGSSGSCTGNAATATVGTTLTVADESSDTSCNVLFTTSATGNLAVKSGTNLTFNSDDGTLTATAFSGSGASLSTLNGSNISSGTVAAARVATLNQNTTGSSASCTGNAATCTTASTTTNITCADESSDTGCNVVFVTSATGDLPPKTGTNLTFNSSTGVLAATTFSGSGASLTSLNASNLGSGTAPTARLGSGTASSSTFLRGDSSWATVTVAINSFTNASNNRVITAVDSSTVNGEANLTFDGSDLTCAGTVTANSDVSLKENIVTIDNAVDKVKALRGVEFDRKDTGVHMIGVIAQEIEEVFPEVVRENEDGIKSVAYGNIVSVLIEAIKEQQVQIEELKNQINS